MKRIAVALVVLCGVLPVWCQLPTAGGPENKKAKPVSPFAEYAGNWTAALNGNVWLQLRLDLKEEGLTGELIHAKNIDLNDNGELKSVSDEQATEAIVGAVVNPDGLLLTLKDADSAETDRYLMKLIPSTKDTADLKAIGVQMPPGMPKPKPWRVVKSGASTANP